LAALASDLSEDVLQEKIEGKRKDLNKEMYKSIMLSVLSSPLRGMLSVNTHMESLKQKLGIFFFFKRKLVFETRIENN
jgi:hypothetical protein